MQGKDVDPQYDYWTAGPTGIQFEDLYLGLFSKKVSGTGFKARLLRKDTILHDIPPSPIPDPTGDDHLQNSTVGSDRLVSTSSKVQKLDITASKH